MKQSLFKWGIAPLVACVLLAPAPTMAEPVKFQITGWFQEVLVPPILCVSDRGQVSLRGEVHVVQMLSDEPRATGRLRAVNLGVILSPDGTGTFFGKAWFEVGTWDADGNFTPTGGVWDQEYSGVIHADGSTEFTKVTGRGIGGTIDGLHVKGTGPRASSSPADPYLFAGQITGPND